MSTGVRPSPGIPPIVPLIPEIDLINGMDFTFDQQSCKKIMKS
jgi:hypothetical protein